MSGNLQDAGIAQLDTAGNVLLLAPSFDPAEDEACMDHLAAEDPSDSNLMSITFVGSPDDRLDRWRRHVGDQLPAKTAVISVGEGNRSAAPGRSGADSTDAPVALDFVSDPGDLTGLGMRITECLSGWDGDGNQNVACVHSLTALLQYIELERAYRFLHVLSGHFDATGTSAHYHMNPEAHDERSINTIKTLMDAVVEIEDGECEITTREQAGKG